MSKRFQNLKKIPAEPAARMLAMTNTKLQTKLTSPASAPVDAVLEELAGLGAKIDILRLLSVALPPREATWWACLAGHDLIGPNPKAVPPPLACAERWVFKPTEENRIAARDAFETADMDDDTTFCAMAALYAEGTLGPGDLNQTPAPPNGVSAAVFAMNLLSMKMNVDRMQVHLDILIDRGLDIARGGNGRVAAGDGAKAEAKG
ncbi:hypothetical protein EGN72_13420 [Pseudorhodobacter sp. E13]|uniref:DUF6931 family protein n=1 Tax=Pseudorhodobacter sp. E13 TaxID=2487931 RepID=UPI000F8D66CE|nr:hypothetical protein [Pseudorhodobacter sp. E13]RUS59692.1 hypothetical protein EGN72_13420 [Pseudorhodobacter sp. E13]